MDCYKGLLLFDFFILFVLNVFVFDCIYCIKYRIRVFKVGRFWGLVLFIYMYVYVVIILGMYILLILLF